MTGNPRHVVAHASREDDASSSRPPPRGLHWFPFQLNLSSSVHRISQLNS